MRLFWCKFLMVGGVRRRLQCCDATPSSEPVALDESLTSVYHVVYCFSANNWSKVVVSERDNEPRAAVVRLSKYLEIV